MGRAIQVTVSELSLQIASLAEPRWLAPLVAQDSLSQRQAMHDRQPAILHIRWSTAESPSSRDHVSGKSSVWIPDLRLHALTGSELGRSLGFQDPPHPTKGVVGPAPDGAHRYAELGGDVPVGSVEQDGLDHRRAVVVGQAGQRVAQA